MTALLGGAALFIPGYECNSPVSPSDFDRLISEYRLTQTALLGDPYCTETGVAVATLLLLSGCCRYCWCRFLFGGFTGLGVSLIKRYLSREIENFVKKTFLQTACDASIALVTGFVCVCSTSYVCCLVSRHCLNSALRASLSFGRNRLLPWTIWSEKCRTSFSNARCENERSSMQDIGEYSRGSFIAPVE